MRSAGEVFGLVLIVVGGIVLLGTVGADAGLAASLQWLWPLLIVGLGLWLMWDAGNRRRSGPPAGWSSWGTTSTPSAPGTPPPPEEWPAGTGATPEAGATGPGPAWSASASWGAGAPAWGPGTFQDRRFLGEVEVAGPLQAGPMRIETFIGEVRLDLTQATFPDGETPIHVSTVIGEVRVLLPADIPASVRVTSMLGESEALGRVSGAFMGDVRAETDDYAAASRRIRLDAQSLIGEVAVRRARPATGPDPGRPPTAPVAVPYARAAADPFAPPAAADPFAAPAAADPFAPPAVADRPAWTPPSAPGAPLPPDEPAAPEASGVADEPPAGPVA